MEKVLQYNYTTAEKSTDKIVEDSGIFGSMMEAVNRTSSGPMHGFGVGLPCSAAYSDYLGGQLTIQSMQVGMVGEAKAVHVVPIAGLGDGCLHQAEAPWVPNWIPNKNLVFSFSSLHRIIYLPIYEIQYISPELLF